VTGTVDVRVVPVVGLVLQVPRVDGNAAGLFLGSIVDLVVAHDFVAMLLPAVHSYSGGKRRLTVIDMPDGSNVHVDFVPFKFVLRHLCPP
jgi:hypothetical protein